MKMPPFELRCPDSLPELLRDLAALGSDARILAGGQSLLPLLRFRVLQPHVVLDIHRIDSLHQCETHDGLRLGALVRHSELASLAPGAPGMFALIREHAQEIAFHPVRTRGTAVGSVVHADPKGDWPLLFCAVNADLHLTSLRGERMVPVREFIQGPLETGRQVDELATALSIPAQRMALSAWGRSKLMHRAGEYALSSALALQYPRGWELWLGSVGGKPVQLVRTGVRLDKDVALSAQDLVCLARQELSELLPELGELECQRHAVNLGDAYSQARARMPS